MAKKKTKAGDPAVTSTPDVTIVIDKVLYDLLMEGKINQILTWKKVEDRPAIIAVTSPQDEEQILLKVTHMDTVGHGYIPKGYPARFAANQKTTRFHVLPLEPADIPEQESEDTQSEHK